MLEVRHSKGKYQVEFADFGETMREFASSIAFVDENVGRLYGSSVPPNALQLPSGESTKSFRYLEESVEELAKLGALRKDRIAAIGGGVVGDLVGFVAATYMRGIDYVQIPTTLLAQVDSSVGGKVAIDIAGGKNLVGAFHPPAAVKICIDVLNTLPVQQFNNGAAEVLKYGAIADPSLLKPLQPNQPALADTVRRSIEIKRDIVQEDEFETKGLRATLNFGHTLGHAIESALGYRDLLHGEAVSIGMVWESALGERLGITQRGTTEELRKLLLAQGLPVQVPKNLSQDQLVAFMKRDKKAQSPNHLTFALITRLGHCKLVGEVAETEVRNLLQST